MSETALEVRGAPLPLTEEARARFTEAQVDLITDAMIPKTADVPTIYRFLEIAARYELDPFANEIWCAQMGGRNGGPSTVAILVGRDGYLKNARRDPDFIDVDADVIYSEDEFKMTRTGDGRRTIEHSYGNPTARGECVAAYAVLRRRDKPDRYFLAPVDQYAKDTDKSAWSYRDAMLTKCAISYITRTTYGVSGPVPADEVGAGLALDKGIAGVEAAPLFGADPELAERIEGLVDRARELEPESWRLADVRGRITGATPGELETFAGEVETWLARREESIEGTVIEGTVPGVNEEVERLQGEYADLTAALEEPQDEDHAEELRAARDKIDDRLGELGTRPR